MFKFQNSKLKTLHSRHAAHHAEAAGDSREHGNDEIDDSWINHFFPQGGWITKSVIARVQPTIQKIVSDFDNGVNPVVNRDTGEKLVSEVSRRTLV